MSLAGIDSLTEFLVAVVAFLGVLKWLVLPVRRALTIAEANRDVTMAQLRRNGGGALVDKNDKMYAAMFPAKGPSMLAMLTEISEQQKLTADIVNDHHKANSARLDSIEAEQRKAAVLVLQVKRKQEERGWWKVRDTVTGAVERVGGRR